MYIPTPKKYSKTEDLLFMILTVEVINFLAIDNKKSISKCGSAFYLVEQDSFLITRFSS